MRNISDRTALITGGAARVGRAITLALAGAGARVAVHYNHSAKAAQEAVARAQALGAEAQAFQADLADPQATRALAAAVQARFGGVDVLVHAASPFVRASLVETTLEMWRQAMGVLAESFLLLAQALAPGMIARGEGAIVAILDRGVFDPWPKYLSHSVGKSALWALARSLAVELAPQVRVNGVVPGPVLPPPGFPQAHVQRLAEGTLLGRWGSPQDVADAVLYLVRADYVTGEVLFVDGGERWTHRR
ncbi:MAG: SDR family oxidoreductase [Anaerolineae bacterium]|nr:SDR family oxidoreductase [Anaerolineae bacterium]